MKIIRTRCPDVTKYLSGFQTPIPKMYFSTFRIKEWEGKATDSEQYIDLEDETINQEYADFFGVEVLEGSMLDEKDGKNMVVINGSCCESFRMDTTGWKEN